MDHSRPQSDLVLEANHRVANSLALLSGLVRMQARALGKEEASHSNREVRHLLEGVAARIATIGHLHRLLSDLPGEGTLYLNGHLRAVCDALVAAFSSDQQVVEIDHFGPDCQIMIKHVQPLTLILCEIVTNALKYAHPTGVPVKMTVLCDPKPTGLLHIAIGDDGVGLPENFNTDKDGGIGLRIIRTLTAEMGGTLAIESGNLGLTYRFTVPQALVANTCTA